MDAEEVDIGPMLYSKHRVRPRNPWAWIRLNGAWHDAHIHHWQRYRGGWLAWVEYDDPEGKPWPRVGMFVYDERTIVPRDGDARPS